MHDIQLSREEQELLQAGSAETKRGGDASSRTNPLSPDDPPGSEPADVRRQLEVVEAFHHDVAERFADALSARFNAWSKCNWSMFRR